MVLVSLSTPAFVVSVSDLLSSGCSLESDCNRNGHRYSLGTCHTGPGHKLPFCPYIGHPVLAGIVRLAAIVLLPLLGRFGYRFVLLMLLAD